MTTIAVLGANGRIGRTVAKAFLDKGHEVVAVTRSGAVPAEIAGARGVAADALDRDALVGATRGAEVIFNGLNPIYTDWEGKCVAMAGNVIEAVRVHGAQHLFPGSIYGFGSPLPPVLSEATPEAPTARKGEIRMAMEAIFREAAERDGVRTTILRAGDFFGGTGAGAWFDQVIASKLARGVYTHPGPAHLVHAWAYLPDLARAFIGLAENRQKLGAFETIHFPGHAATGEEFRLACEKALGRPLKATVLPWTLLRLGGLVNPMWREFSRMSYLWHQPHRLVSTRLEALVGPLPATPLERAVEEALGALGLLPTASRRAA